MKKYKTILLGSTFFILSILGFKYSNAQCVSPTIAFTVDDEISCFGASDGGITADGYVLTGSPLLISEVDFGSPDFIEITNVSGGSFNTNGYYVATSNSYTSMSSVNSNIWTLSGTWSAGQVDYRDDNSSSGAKYWGSNLLYNPGENIICK